MKFTKSVLCGMTILASSVLLSVPVSASPMDDYILDMFARSENFITTTGKINRCIKKGQTNTTSVQSLTASDLVFVFLTDWL